MSKEISLGLELLLALLSILKPSDLQKIKNEVKKREEEIEKNKNIIRRAVVGGDIDAINILFFGEL